MNPRRLATALVPACLLVACSDTSAARLQLGQSTDVARNAAAGGGTADSKLAVWAPVVSYEAGAELDDPKWMDGVGRERAWKFVAPSSPGRDLARIAGALGVDEPLVQDPVNKGSWSNDPSSGGPSFSSWGDEHGRWWTYTSSATARSGTSTDPSSGTSPGTVVAEPCPPDTKECVVTPPTIPPAENLPGKSKATDLALALLGRMGVDTTAGSLRADVSADDWSVRVNVTAVHDGVPVWLQSWWFGFGGNAVLTDASGPLVSLEKADSYPVITPVQAVERLKRTGAYSATGGARDAVVGAPADTSVEPTVVTLVTARLSLVEWGLADGTMMLLPAWELSDGGDNEVKVVAVTDDFIEWPTPDTSAVAPGTAVPPVSVPSSGSGSGGSGGGDVPAQVITNADAQRLVGLAEDEAVKIATGNGWTVRIVARDGEKFMVTTDYSPGRVNLTVSDGRVTTVTVG